jgi:hypothetical protein
MTIAEPDIYLSAQLGKMNIDGLECWTMSAEKYVLASVRNVEESLAKKGLRLPTKCYTPLPPDYRPELDTTNELKSDGTQCFQELESFDGLLSSAELTYSWRCLYFPLIWSCREWDISIKCIGSLVI